MLQLRSFIEVIIVKFVTELRRKKYNLYQHQNLKISQTFHLTVLRSSLWFSE